MEYNVREAATLMGLHPRTVRRLVAAGKIAGIKRDGVWMVEAQAITLSSGQTRARSLAAEAVRTTVEGALASAGRRSLLDLRAFQTLHGIVASLPEADPARRLLEHALGDLAAGAYAFQPEDKIPLLRQCRSGIARGIVTLTLRSGLPPEGEIGNAIGVLEHDTLPAVAGMLRRAERDEARHP